MCRYDDDFEWSVQGMDLTRLDHDEQCPDCGRTVPAGADIWALAVESANWEDLTYLWWGAFWPLPGGRRYATDADPHIRLPDSFDHGSIEECNAKFDAFEALGFDIHEMDGEAEGAHWVEYWCPQCRAADRWLREVCDQYTVQVARIDLAEHAAEYDIGPALNTLATMANRQWRTPTGTGVAHIDLVKTLTTRAITEAETAGIA